MIIEKDKDIQGVIRIVQETKGPRVVMFGGVHGDEVSGVHAIEKLLFDFFGGLRVLRRGTLVLARANEAALAQERRYVKYNLNRMFRDAYEAEDGMDWSSYELVRVQELKKLLSACDYFFDFHSAPIAQDPFLVVEKENLQAFAGLGIARIITGWSKFSGGAIGGDAENYANAHGAISATLESGSHFAKSSIDVAYRAALSLLSNLDMIERVESQSTEPAGIDDMYRVVTKEYDDFRYAGPVENFQLVKANTAFAFQNNAPLTVTEDSYLLIPMSPEATKLREEVCYLGRKLDGA